MFEKQYGKIQTLRILSGGVPRTLLLLLSIISKKNTGDAVDYLHEMIEQVTPLYQDRMKALSSQQQEIMHHLAMHWDRTPVKELAKEMRIPSKSISAQLAALESMGYVNKVETKNRNNYYEIDERFFNIWLLMSEAPPYDSKRVIWLTKWLDAFYSNEELKDYAAFCNISLRTAKPGSRFLIAQALSESEKLDDSYKHQLVTETAENLKDYMREVETWAAMFKNTMNSKSKQLSKEVIAFIQQGNTKNALDKLDLLEQIDEANAFNGKGIVYYYDKKFSDAEKYYLKAVEKNNVNAMYNLGNFYRIIKNDMVNSEKYYLLAAENGHSGAMYNLGYFYNNEKKDITNSEKYYLLAAENGHIGAMYNLGIFYHKIKKDIINSEKYYLIAAENGHVNAMNNLGVFYEKDRKDIFKAEKYYLMAIEKGNVNAMSNLGMLYEEKLNDLIKAEKYYLMAIEKGNVNAMNYLGMLYEEKLNDLVTAEKYYQMAARKGSSSALFNLALLYEEKLNDIITAEKYYLMAIETNDYKSMANLANLYFITNNISNKTKALELTGKCLEASNYDSVIAMVVHLYVLLWNKNVKDAIKIMEKLLADSLNKDHNMALISEALQYFLVFRQKQFLYQTFTSNQQLIDRYKPVYYALLHELQEEYPNEYLKMTEELKEPVNAILDFVKKEQIRLGV